MADQRNAHGYPARPGFKRTATSRDAGRKIAGHAATVRSSALAQFCAVYPDGLTADEIAKRLGESVLCVRPRCSELRALHLIEQTTERRRNDSGMSAAVWRATLEAIRKVSTNAASA